jgi:cytoskeletal protein RodZ
MKPSKTTYKKSSESISARRLRVIDHSVRGAFISLGVAVLSLSVLGGVVSIFNAAPTDFAQAQSNPTEPSTTPIELPGQSPTTNTTTNPTAPSTNAPEIPIINNEVISVGGGSDEVVIPNTTTQPTTQTTGNNPTITPEQQALNVAQQTGTTARSGGVAVVAGLALMVIVGYYVYYKTKGDRKSILKMAEKKINLK